MVTYRLAVLGSVLMLVGVGGWIIAFLLLRAIDDPDPAGLAPNALSVLLLVLPVVAIIGVLAVVVGAAIADHGEVAGWFDESPDADAAAMARPSSTVQTPLAIESSAVVDCRHCGEPNRANAKRCSRCKRIDFVPS